MSNATTKVKRAVRLLQLEEQLKTAGVPIENRMSYVFLDLVVGKDLPPGSYYLCYDSRTEDIINLVAPFSDADVKQVLDENSVPRPLEPDCYYLFCRSVYPVKDDAISFTQFKVEKKGTVPAPKAETAVANKPDAKASVAPAGMMAPKDSVVNVLTGLDVQWTNPFTAIVMYVGKGVHLAKCEWATAHPLGADEKEFAYPSVLRKLAADCKRLKKDARKYANRKGMIHLLVDWMASGYDKSIDVSRNWFISVQRLIDVSLLTHGLKRNGFHRVELNGASGSVFSLFRPVVHGWVSLLSMDDNNDWTCSGVGYIGTEKFNGGENKVAEYVWPITSVVWFSEPLSFSEPFAVEDPTGREDAWVVLSEHDRRHVANLLNSKMVFLECVVCADNILGAGNNAAPVGNGVCCDKCNINVVLPARLQQASVECSVCGEDIVGHGNNAAPVANGRCCDACNLSVVIPARLQHALEKKADPPACECKPDWDVRCRCHPGANSLVQFSKCPQRVDTIVFMIGNDDELYLKAMSGDFSFLKNKFEMSDSDQAEIIRIFKESHCETSKTDSGSKDDTGK